MKAFETKEVLLSVKNLTKSYGDNLILRNIDIDIHNLIRPDVPNQGQIVSLIGKSGSGKSTLFRLVAGIENGYTGTISKFDKPDVMSPICEGDVGVVFQNSYVYPWRKVRQILYMAAKKNKDNSTKTINDNIMKYVDILELGEHINKFANQLSGGQRQRVAIAEQILNGGDFILLDEPFSGLDVLSIDKVTRSLSRLVGEDEVKTIILISHDLSNSLAISDTAFILAKEGNNPGATITNRISLASMGLAWEPEIKENPEFRNLLKYVKEQL